MFAKLENVSCLTLYYFHESESALFEGNTAFFRARQKKNGGFYTT